MSPHGATKNNGRRKEVKKVGGGAGHAMHLELHGCWLALSSQRLCQSTETLIEFRCYFSML
jgi:hypothetical protein